MTNGTNNKRTTLFIIMTTLFCFWGLANNMTGVLQTAFGKILEIGDVQAVLIQSAFYAAYFCFALPATYYIYRYSYKGALLVGLLLYAMGAMLFFPASSVGSVYFYILAIYIMAGGCAILETIANPYIISLGRDHDDGIRKLNLAQSFNPMGSIAGILLGNTLVINNLNNIDNTEVMHEELDTITLLYATIGEVLMIFMVLMVFVSMPVSPRLKQSGSHKIDEIKMSLQRVFKQRKFIGGIVAIFLYVGAQSGSWGYITTVVEGIDSAISANANTIYLIAMISFCAFRFLFTALMGSYRWSRLLLTASIAASVLCLVVVFGDGISVIMALVLISAMMSLMFPTIFGAALSSTGNDMQTGSAILIMAICGGLLILPVQKLMAGSVGPQMSYIVPTLCFMAIAGYAVGIIMHERKK